MSARNLLGVVKRAGANRLQPFVAPVPEAEEVTLFTVQNGVPYRFGVSRVEPGWWEFDTAINPVRPAYVREILAPLSSLPRFYVIAVHALSPYTWLCVPASNQDASQRNWRNGQPRPLHLVRAELQPFDLIVARDMAGVLLFDDVDMRLDQTALREGQRLWLEGHELDDSKHREVASVYGMLQALQERQKQLQLEVAERESRARLAAELQTEEGRIRHELAFMGAELVDWRKMPTGYSVTWKDDKRAYTMTIRPDMRVSSAGICLAGTDSEHTLASIVAVMKRGHELRRPDLDYHDEDD